MKKTIAWILCIVLVLGAVPMAAAARDLSLEENLAVDLKALGLFQGVSDTDFDLARAPSRTEALVMLIRVLGKEGETLAGTWAHPFTDVAAWADKYVGYAYENGLTNGVSATEFGTGTADSAMYLTFVLRALGYSDDGGADFTWSEPYELAGQTGLLQGPVNSDDFWRADVVLISYAALSAALKGSAQTLAGKLIAADVFTTAQFDANYNLQKIAPATSLTAEEIYAKCSSAVFYIEVFDKDDDLLATGSGFFISGDGTAVTNYHVIARAHSAKITVSDTGSIYDVQGVYDYDELDDWAVIKVNGSGFSHLTQGAASTVVGGATVYAIGSPLGLQSSITQGIISNPRREEYGTTYIQTSAAISSGSSGGALLNQYGEVIGITTAGYVYGQNLNLALPISYIVGVSQSGLKTLSQIEKDTDFFDLLTQYVVRYDTESKDDNIYTLTLLLTDSKDSYSIVYNVAEQMLTVSGNFKAVNPKGWQYIKHDDDIRVTIFMQAVADSYDCQVDFLALDATLGGKLTASSFDADTSFSRFDLDGNARYKSECMEIAPRLTYSALLGADLLLYMFRIPIRMEDLGFTSLYE